MAIENLNKKILDDITEDLILTSTQYLFIE